MFCQYCNRDAKSKNSNSQHELYCKSNPNAKKKTPSYGMVGKKGSNQHIKGTAVPLSEEGRQRIVDSNKRRVWSAEKRLAHSERMKEVARNNPQSYSSSNRGRVKEIVFNGISFQGNWELEFYKWAIAESLDIERCTKGFQYLWEGNRTYYPDFYIKSLDLFVEVKGYKTGRDNAKWTQFPGKLLIVDRKSIDSIRKGCYNLNIK